MKSYVDRRWEQWFLRTATAIDKSEPERVTKRQEIYTSYTP